MVVNVTPLGHICKNSKSKQNKNSNRSYILMNQMLFMNLNNLIFVKPSQQKNHKTILAGLTGS